ncbi:MAG: type II toxin-antitoxin system RelE/ParE family toxin [Archaeoglobaceae archaeon]
MNYEIFLSKQANDFLQKLDVETRARIKEKLIKLSENPFSIPYKKIKGRENTYSIRVGKYRIIYTLRREEIWILKIDKRERVYERI